MSDADHPLSTDAASFDLEDEAATAALASALGDALAPGDTLLLEGELGAGKTFFARAVCRALGVPEDEPVQSPTFALLHEHEGRVPIVHGDLYRLGDPAELLELGLDERLGEDAVVLLEWGAEFAAELGEIALRIDLGITGESSRSCRVSAMSERGRALLSALLAVPGARW